MYNTSREPWSKQGLRGDNAVSVWAHRLEPVYPLVGNVESRGSYAHPGAEGIWEISAPSSYTAVNLKLPHNGYVTFACDALPYTNRTLHISELDKLGQ